MDGDSGPSGKEPSFVADRVESNSSTIMLIHRLVIIVASSDGGCGVF